MDHSLTLWVSHEETSSPTLSTRPRRSRTVAWQCSPSLGSLHSMLPQVCTAAIASLPLATSATARFCLSNSFWLSAHAQKSLQPEHHVNCTLLYRASDCSPTSLHLVLSDGNRSHHLGHGFAASASHIRHPVSGSAAGADCELCSCRSCLYTDLNVWFVAGKGPIDNLFDHIANPGQVNFATNGISLPFIRR